MADPRTAAEVFERLTAVIAARKNADPETSYVAKRLALGIDRIAQKVGEEAVETAIAAVRREPKEVVSESADLLFHLLMLWSAMDIAPTDVLTELARREGKSGIAEKAARGPQTPNGPGAP